MAKKINQMSELTKKAIIRKSAQGLPDRPSASGMRTEDIKKAFYIAMTDEQDSVFAELARIIDEANNAFGDNDQHIEDKDNPHNVTKEQIGLSNVDNTSDKDKPISTAQKEAFDALYEEVAKKVDNTVKVNGKPLTDDVNLSPGDIGALSKDIKYVESINGKSGVIDKLATEDFVIENSSGRANSHAISIESNSIFNSQESMVKVTDSIVDIEGKTILLSSLRVGDTIYVLETDLPDRWFTGLYEEDGTQYAYFAKLETAKVPVVDVQKGSGESIVNNGVAVIPIATGNNAGLVKSDEDTLTVSEDGTLKVNKKKVAVLYGELGEKTDGSVTQKVITKELEKKVENTRKINNKPLSEDITLGVSDIENAVDANTTQTISGKKVLEQGLSSDNSVANIKATGDGYYDFATAITRGDIFFGYNQNGDNPVSIYNFGNSTGQEGQRQGKLFAGGFYAENLLYSSKDIEALDSIKAGKSITKGGVEVVTLDDLPTDYISFTTAQGLTEEQKAQARENLGVAGEESQSTGSYKDLLNKPFDLVITSQAEFKAMLASDTWLDAKSVAFIGNGGTLEFTTDNTIIIPQTVVQIQGFNNAIIRISTTDYLTYGILYSTKPNGSQYSFRDIKILITYSVNYGIWGARNLINCTNVTLEVPEQPSSVGLYERTGFFQCDNLVNCKATAPLYAYSSCSNIINCSATVTREEYSYGYMDCSYGVNSTGTTSNCTMWFDKEPNTVCLPLGTIFASATPQTSKAFRLLDGSTITSSENETFVNYINSVAGQYNIAVTEEEYETILSTYGQCGKFVVTSTSIRLPTITKIIEGLTDLESLSDIGEAISAGLPNIKFSASYYSYSASANGALTKVKVNNSAAGGGGTTGKWYEITVDASGSSKIYGNSDTVQPETIKYPYYIVVSTKEKITWSSTTTSAWEMSATSTELYFKCNGTTIMTLTSTGQLIVPDVDI